MNNFSRQMKLILTVYPIVVAVLLAGCGGGGSATPAATSTTYSISGTVTGATASVTINLTGMATATTTTDSTGNYSFPGLANGSYTVAPSLAGYTFSQISSAVSVSGANVTGKDFTATASTSTTYSLSGTVSGAVAKNVLLTLSGGATGSAYTDASGNYSFSGLMNGSYTVTPSLAGYTFTPANSAVTIGANSTANNFTSSGGGSAGNFTTCAGAGLQAAGANLCLAKSSVPLAVNGYLRSVAYGNGLWVTVGSNGTIATSTDAANWTARSSGTTSTLYSVAYSNGIWVAVGTGVALYSNDGITWSAGSGVATTSPLFSVAYGSVKWLATGSFNGTAVSYTSSDGKSWVLASSTLSYLDRPLPTTAYAPPWAVFGNSKWLGGDGSNGMVSSTDGVNWQVQVTYNWPSGRAAAFGNGLWVEVNSYDAGKSSDGLNWVRMTPSTSANLLYQAVGFGNAMWVLVGGNNGIVVTSSDASVWNTVRTDSSGYIQQLDGVAYGNGRWVIVGGGGATAVGVILVSTSSNIQ